MDFVDTPWISTHIAFSNNIIRIHQFKSRAYREHKNRLSHTSDTISILNSYWSKMNFPGAYICIGIGTTLNIIIKLFEMQWKIYRGWPKIHWICMDRFWVLWWKVQFAHVIEEFARVIEEFAWSPWKICPISENKMLPQSWNGHFSKQKIALR